MNQGMVCCTLKEISERIGGFVSRDPDLRISGISEPRRAKPGDLVYVDQVKKMKEAEDSLGSALLVPIFEGECAKPFISVKNPKLAFAKLLQFFYPSLSPDPEIHPTAVIDSGAVVSEKSYIGAHVFIGKNAVIEDHVVLSPFTYVGEEVQIGENSFIHPHVSLLKRVKIGRNCIIHPGAVIGGEGFGYVPDEKGDPFHIPQIGTVVLEDEVEIGSNTTIDRAALGETRIGKRTKIDNLVQIAHNCQIGENCLIAAMVGISGSVKIGKGTVIGGQAGFRDHLNIGENCVIAAGAEVWGDLKPNSFVSGAPARDHKEHLKIQAFLRKLPEIVKDLRDLKKRRGSPPPL